MINIIGWIGSIFLAFCGLPQAIKSIKNKNSDGMTWGMLILWQLGECTTMIYIILKKEYPLFFNYIFNIIFVSIIIYFKLKIRWKKQTN